ncbi:polysaccharide deacetylase family protein [Clostridium aminobutyricum]|uniref:Polysaccharide deacetylase family protein n=1 Tax=Clostridium aminobutyricum TaxID=33953 RepID=A0A939IIM6_CLOAM|nr:polysaccharide deacetylase family protein [Clostridium aminobutyricum]MBN7772708.1 polysaccharide deacetylase family protein [Clostridium aminobutyricum]
MHKPKWIKFFLINGLILCCFFLSISAFLIHFTTPRVTASLDSILPSDKIALPIIMYHGLIKDQCAQNQYCIAPDLLEGDLKYLKNNGYHTITMTELINYVYNDAPLPENPIILTFDDGNYNNYYYAFPLLKQYDQKAVIAIIGIHTDKYSLIKIMDPYYSNLSWGQINEMIMSGHVEIQNHTYNMHSIKGDRKGCAKKSSESFEEYQKALTEDLERLQQRITDFTGTTPNTMVYPFGYYSKETEEVIKGMGFKSSLTCAEKINYISKDKDSLYKLGRFLRPPDESSAAFFKDILKS